ncbi:PREDICTED: immunoglobulin-like and fibronectin type III domain-containing protein 1 isoform X1 [Cyprinodon variegatus]|uniref:immunoglobulin-like and fibronectin type III domain-containing protein 1 isoform X1 n=1 Tax=Cyprinodon variegatus TaxID=28743 RepID=UPI0007429313|nr:PREDICTED: immunoglobulin-like and fibronectin type III domain-containing protein 1 isoform X1 [Cyprinodon variegatus]
MWARGKKSGQLATRPSCFSIVHQYIQRFNEVSGNKSAVIRRRSKTPGVMITQYTSTLPEGKSTPDFRCKPMPVTVKEGELAVFKAVVTGEPKPEVSWRRAKGPLADKERFQRRYDESTGEHILEIHKVSAVEADTYKCYAVNECGKAVCTTTLNVFDVSTNPEDFRKLLKKSKAQTPGGENDETFWDVMLNADKRDYESICSEYGVVDLNMILKKLEEKRKKKEKDKQKDIMNSWDSVPEEQCNQSFGTKSCIKIEGLVQSDTGIYIGDPEEANRHNTQLNHASPKKDILLTGFKLSNVDFMIKIQEIKAEENDDALFECVLTHPLPKITWIKKGIVLEDGEKYSITVSDNKLIHRLLIRNCTKLDKGIYSAIAGIISCSAWLVVEDQHNPADGGTKLIHKTAKAAGAQSDLEKVAKEQQMKIQEEMEKILKAVKGKYSETEKLREDILPHVGHRGESEKTGKTQKANSKDNTLTAMEYSGHETGAEQPLRTGDLKKKFHNKDQVVCNIIPERKNTKDDAESTFGDFDVIETGEQLREGDLIKKEQSGQVGFNTMTERKNTRGATITTSTDYGMTEVEEKVRDDNLIKKIHHKDQVGSNTETDSNKGEPQQDQEAESEVIGDKHLRENQCDDVEQQSQFRGKSSLDKEARTQRKTKNVHWKEATSDNGQQSGDELNNTNENEGSADQGKRQHVLKEITTEKNSVNGKFVFSEDHGECEEDENMSSAFNHPRRKRQVPLITDSLIDPGVHFIQGLSDIDAIIHESAELTCKLSRDDCEGVWFRDGKKIYPDDNISITMNGSIHKLVIMQCSVEHSGKYRFEADGRKTEAMINIRDPPRFDPEDLSAFTRPLTLKVGHNAIFKLQFIGHKPIKVQWYRDGDELQDDNSVRIEKSASHSRLLLIRCQRRDTGEIKIKIRNDHGFTEAVSQLIVLDKPSAPMGPAEVTESSASCIEFKWRPPKDDGGSPVTNYILERQQVGRNTWKKIGEIPGVPIYRDTDVDRGRKYCYRIWAVTSEGISEVMETDEMQAGRVAFPGPPAPPKVVSAFNECIKLSWSSPAITGGSRLLGYILEKRKQGSNLWTVVNAPDEIIKEKKYAVRDVVEGMAYEFRVCAINLSGAGEFSNASEFVFARDPKKPPGKVIGLKVTETSYTNMVVTWTKPEDKPGIQDEAKGYFVEIRQADRIEWSRCNSTPIIMTSFNVKGLRSMEMYWVRVIAVNDGGESIPEELPNYILAMPLPVRPRFTNNKMKSFMVVRAGNSVRITVSFEASPRPEITWLKDNVPVTKRATVSNSDGSSQLLIPTSERSDTGIYSVLVKNIVGQETFRMEVRVTDDPKPPGPVELEENVPGTVTVIWKPSLDEKRDDRLHYTVSKLDSTKHTWTTVADRLFNNRFTVCNIVQGREYHFRVYAKNDMGTSAPSESPIWGTEKKKEKIVITKPKTKDYDLRCTPTFIVLLKPQTATLGYECYMSCAVRGNPAPRITWYRSHVNINTDTNYYISNTCGVCSLLILHVSPKDVGEYTVVAENSLGRAECSTVLSIKAE